MDTGGAAAELVPLALYLLLAALFAVLGLVFLARPARAAALLADEDARKTFKPRDMRTVGVVFTAGGAFLLILGIVRLLVVLAQS